MSNLPDKRPNKVTELPEIDIRDLAGIQILLKHPRDQELMTPNP